MTPQVIIVDDDDAFALSLQVLLKAAGIERVIRFESPSRLLDDYSEFFLDMKTPGCLLMDIRLPEMSGAVLFSNLQSKGPLWPVIFMTGHGDLSTAVDLMKAGAFDYVTKPFDPMGLIQRIKAATTLSQRQLADHWFNFEHHEKLASLTTHEREVFARILGKQTSREIAEAMHNSARTIETHRANVFKKMGVVSALELAQNQDRFLLTGGITPFDTTVHDTQ